MVLATLIVNSGGNYGVHREDGQFLHSGDVKLSSENDLSDCVDVFSQGLVEQ